MPTVANYSAQPSKNTLPAGQHLLSSLLLTPTFINCLFTFKAQQFRFKNMRQMCLELEGQEALTRIKGPAQTRTTYYHV